MLSLSTQGLGKELKFPDSTTLYVVWFKLVPSLKIIINDSDN